MKNNNPSGGNKILIIILLFVIGFLLWSNLKLSTNHNEEKFMAYLDSMNKRNEVMFNKIDSLSSVKHEQFKVYEKLNLKYDTIQVAIDTMPDIDGTKLLLSISRQLTAKGVE